MTIVMLLIVLLVSMGNFTGLNLDKKLESLLYVFEDEDVEDNALPQEVESTPSNLEGFEELPQIKPSTATEADSLKILEEIYREGGNKNKN